MFVGYRGELDELTARLAAASGGAGQVVLVSGEPGIGKTRLARELAEIASAQGIRTCWGRATEDDGSPPYWPFRLVVRRLAGGHAPGPLADDIAFVAPRSHPDARARSPRPRNGFGSSRRSPGTCSTRRPRPAC